MNRSHSPILRPLSNISNRKLTFTNVQTKPNEKNSKSFAVNSVLFPQQFGAAKSTIQEVKTIKNDIITPKSSISSFTSTPRLSSNNEDDSKSTEFKKTFNNQQNSKFLLFKIIVILSLIAFALLLYQIQGNLLMSQKSNKLQIELQFAKEKMIADSVSNSIIQTVVYDHKKINLEKEKNDVKSFYQDEFSSNLWKLVVEKVNRDLRIRLEKQDTEEFWTIFYFSLNSLSTYQQTDKKTGQLSISELEIQAVIGFRGINTQGLILHPDNEHILYPLGQTIIVRHLISRAQRFQGSGVSKIIFNLIKYVSYVNLILILSREHDNQISVVTISRSEDYVVSGQQTYIWNSKLILLFLILRKEA